jgi:uncharacterized protein YbjT (DUF2867 family)
MILVAGGTGTLGSRVVRLLIARGLDVRILTREAARAGRQPADYVEVVTGDVRDPDAATRAVNGAGTVISAIQGFQGTGDVSPRTVDWEGNRNLIHAARTAGVEHFILVSMHGAAPDSRMDLLRMKYRAEQELRTSGLAWTIIRPTVSMQTWVKLLGEPLLRTGKTRVFGRGNNPINFVSADDVAEFVELSVVDPATRGEVIEVGGPENPTVRQFVDTFARVTGRTGKVSAVPLPMMRVMSILMPAVNPARARQIQAGIIMDTEDMSFDASETWRRYPTIGRTSVADFVRRDYVPVIGDAAGLHVS